MPKGHTESSTTPAAPPEELIRELIQELGRLFDLSTPIGDRVLGEAMEERLRSLRPAEQPEWGIPGDVLQVAKRAAGPLDFFYRPHLFPEMDPALRLGHLLQFDLLPRHLPAASPLSIAAVLESYCHLSGDLLGWRLEGNELFLWIADISGHGVRAGLAAAVLHFLANALGPGLEPAELARRMNESMLAARQPSDHRPLFATACWLRYGADGRGLYASSGHPPMLLRRSSGDVESLGATGRPLGLLAGETFEQHELRLAPGDRLCLFTDGLIESPDPEGNEFGDQRVADVLRRSSGGPFDTARELYRAVQEHRATTLLDDDLTFLVIEPAPG